MAKVGENQPLRSCRNIISICQPKTPKCLLQCWLWANSKLSVRERAKWNICGALRGMHRSFINNLTTDEFAKLAHNSTSIGITTSVICRDLTLCNDRRRRLALLPRMMATRAVYHTWPFVFERSSRIFCPRFVPVFKVQRVRCKGDEAIPDAGAI